MKTRHLLLVGLSVVLTVAAATELVQARGRGGGGRSFGGGGRSFGGGGGRSFRGGGRSFSGGGRSFGGGGYSRPTPSRSYSRPSVSRSGSYSRPSQPIRSSSPRVGSGNIGSGNFGSRNIGSRTPGSVQFPRSGSSQLGNRQIGSGNIGNRNIGSNRPTNRIGDGQIGRTDRTPANRIGDRQIGGTDRTPANRIGDGQIGRTDRTSRLGDGQLGRTDRTSRDIARRAAIPGLAAGAGAAAGSRLSGDMQNRLSERRSQFQNRDGSLRSGAQDRFANRQDMVSSRRDNLQSRFDDRQANRGDRLDDRQNYRDNAREDWQDWADNNHWDDHWNYDHWNDFGDGWNYMWDNYPVYSAFRVTSWGLNRASWLFGWGAPYYNPYPVDPYPVGTAGAYVDYSEPLISDAPMEQYVPYDEASGDAKPADPAVVGTEGGGPVPSAPGVPPEAASSFDAAQSQFMAGNYDEALKSVDAAIAVLPKDAALHEFRSLVLFALGKYRDSAAAIHAVLAVGPGMNWTTMSSLYGSVSDYTTQLRALEEYIRKNSDATDARFLLSYHYITCGHTEQAKKQLAAVVKAEPKDSVAADLLRMLGGDAPTASEPPPLKGEKAKESDLIGSWAAKRDDGSTFEVTLSKDGQFVWAYGKEGAKTQQIKGVFVVDDGELAMEPDSGGVMLADVAKTGEGQFAFRQAGGAGTNTSIVFQKQ